MSDAKHGVHTVYKTTTSNGLSYYPSYHDAIILGALEYGPGAEWMGVTKEVLRFDPKVGQNTSEVVHLLNNGFEWQEMNVLLWSCDTQGVIDTLIRIVHTYEEGHLLPDEFTKAEWYLLQWAGVIIAPWGLNVNTWRVRDDVTKNKQQYVHVNAEHDGHLLHGRFGIDTMLGRVKVYANQWQSIKDWLDYHNEMEL